MPKVHGSIAVDKSGLMGMEHIITDTDAEKKPKSKMTPLGEILKKQIQVGMTQHLPSQSITS